MSLKANETSASKVITQEHTASERRSERLANEQPSSSETREPHHNDVLCGRGGSINNHPGNEKFRQLVERRKHVYLAAQFKREKRLVACSIVSDIRNQDPPGRFLSFNPKTGFWLDIGDEKARGKTSHALRGSARSIRAEMENESSKLRAAAIGDEKEKDKTGQAGTGRAKMEMGNDNSRVEMKQSRDEDAGARASEAQQHGHHSARGHGNYWGHHPAQQHNSYVPRPKYADNKVEEHERHRSSPVKGCHPPKLIRLSCSGPPQKRDGPPSCYRGGNTEHLPRHLHTFHTREQSREEHNSVDPPVFAPLGKPSLSFSGQASCPQQGGGPLNHPLPMGAAGGNKNYPAGCGRDGGERGWVHLLSPDHEKGRSKISRRRHHRSHEDLSRAYPPGFESDGGRKRSVHLRSPGHDMRRKDISRRHYHGSRAYEDYPTFAKKREHKRRGCERYGGDPAKRRSSSRLRDEQPAHSCHDNSIEQRERQRISFSPVTVPRQNPVSPRNDVVMEEDPPQAPSHPGPYDPRYRNSSQRPLGQQHQRPPSPDAANYVYCWGEAEEPALDPLLFWCEEGPEAKRPAHE